MTALPFKFDRRLAWGGLLLAGRRDIPTRGQGLLLAFQTLSRPAPLATELQDRIFEAIHQALRDRVRVLIELGC